MSRRKFKRFKEAYIIPILIVLLSFMIISLTNGSFFSFIILTTGLLNGWYAGLGKWYNYIFGAVFSICNAIVSWDAHLYGIAVLSALLYFPLQMQGLFDWHNRKNKNSEVRVRSFNLRNSILITLLCFCGSIGFGYILTRVPGQQLAFLDASSNVINICGIVLLNLRFRECWWVFLGNNIADLVIWIINFTLNVPNATVMLIVSLGYIVMNLFGLVKWEKIKNKIRY